MDVSYEAKQLRLEVLDSGPGRATDSQGAGTGLTGLRERATLVGGHLEAGTGARGRVGCAGVVSRPRGRCVTGQPLRVLIADDQRLVHAGLRMILEAQPDITVVA